VYSVPEKINPQYSRFKQPTYMNMIRKTAAIAAGSTLMSFMAAAQLSLPLPPKPVRSGQDIIHGLFQIPEQELNYNFTTVLPGGNYMIAGFRRLSDWRPDANLNGLVAIAGHVLDGYRDSMQDGRSSKKLEVHIPISNTPVTSRYQSWSDPDLVTESAGVRSILKISMDTLRIVKNIAIRPPREEGGEEEIVQVQYTFLLKDMNQFRQLAKEVGWQEKTVAVFDSLVAVQRHKWTRQDAWFHYMYVRYEPEAANSKKVLQVRTSLNTGNEVYGNKVFNVDAGFGVLLVRNTICPNVEVGLNWNFYSDKEESAFARLSMNTFMRFEEQADKTFKGYSTAFLNAELGSRSANANTRLPFYQFSLGFGYMLHTNTGKYREFRDPSMSADMYKLFFNYSISKAITITPEFVSNLKRQNKGGNGWVGLGVLLRIF
jgi:hypothetical protein